jgi:hypothetical protein
VSAFRSAPHRIRSAPSTSWPTSLLRLIPRCLLPYGAPDRGLCITPQPRLRLLICIAAPPPLSVPSLAVATVTSRPSSTPTFADPPSAVATVQSDQRPLHRCPRRPRLRVAAGSITTPPPPTPAASPAAYLSLFPIAPQAPTAPHSIFSSSPLHWQRCLGFEQALCGGGTSGFDVGSPLPLW